ncbi:hypothetical protein POJ06DRAFT_284426 [Lipomyces tetrasporus]|uniref:Uncharacterized protein n=1 Tax=Lipomyces tetrasporus TaxID=54092 RepID=A0AAD7QYB1_9ASCO|nr:uncharacterized protein POJ06DRAFT_284426 [Lipomyces tetrasporus]KAJ8103591.1 hypothetical protein POJ06DRAFT_284426 [Lipomyces tetrasporus]
MSVTESQAVSNYNEAFTLLKENSPEQRLDIQLPYENISEDQRYPSLTYNSLTQTVTVVTSPGSIHEGAARWIDSEIRELVKAYLSIAMESAVRETAQQSYYGPLEYRGHSGW